MKKKPSKYHYIYKITNNITGHYYVGCHSTSNLMDGYMGSGFFIKKAIKKYGKENFEMVILKMCLSRGEMFKNERFFIDEELVSDPKCYNLMSGGKRWSKNSFKVSAKSKECYWDLI